MFGSMVIPATRGRVNPLRRGARRISDVSRAALQRKAIPLLHGDRAAHHHDNGTGLARGADGA
jgi:hypothetical protein